MAGSPRGGQQPGKAVNVLRTGHISLANNLFKVRKDAYKCAFSDF